MLAVSPESVTLCDNEDVASFMNVVMGWLVPKNSFPVVNSFVLHETVAVVVPIAEVATFEITGAVVSATLTAGVVKLCCPDVARLPETSVDVTT